MASDGSWHFAPSDAACTDKPWSGRFERRARYRTRDPPPSPSRKEKAFPCDAAVRKRAQTLMAEFVLSACLSWMDPLCLCADEGTLTERRFWRERNAVLLKATGCGFRAKIWNGEVGESFLRLASFGIKSYRIRSLITPNRSMHSLLFCKHRGHRNGHHKHDTDTLRNAADLAAN